MISIYRSFHRKDHPHSRCTPKSFGKFVRSWLHRLKRNTLRADCHFVKQVLYTKTQNHLRRMSILKMEHLESEFNALMAEYGLLVKLSPMKSNAGLPNCDLSLKDIPLDIHRLIEDYYANDYDAFGYQRWATL
eukprot:gnl/MRDRNA2_/MRDRNA2_50700_c0_seq1.p1 gnl/MRDRNA2_/MRDRNA2_50700_c0~~gnl/MRDRNA2_/MRDRNA2_50700_c0_seq1.p1  ORF type:complete len:133 (+),score=11.34 gnl/MRDRNA2_/MRDRNA2_50700_c0_seq1:423-821(+)